MFQFNQPCYHPSKLIFIKPNETDMKLVEKTMQREQAVKAEARKQKIDSSYAYPAFSHCFESPLKVKVICTKREIHEYEHVYRYEEKEIIENRVIDIDKRERLECPYES
ncbi:MAG TPA: hypothetical protein DCY20_07725 [Firmicutes bacterium]|nr:hypothetical protein [Bacillota bacterium]